MKKLIAICLTVVMLFCAAALAANTIKPEYSVNMAEPLKDCMLKIGFNIKDVNDKEIIAMVYDDVLYDIVDVHEMKLGDTLVLGNGEIVIESIAQKDYGIEINGGDEVEGGVLLKPVEESTYYCEMAHETPNMIVLGQAQLTFADNVTVNVYKMNEDLSIAGEGYDTVTVPAAGVKAELEKIAAKLGEEFSPHQASVLLNSEGKLDEITIDYVP